MLINHIRINVASIYLIIITVYTVYYILLKFIIIKPSCLRDTCVLNELVKVEAIFFVDYFPFLDIFNFDYKSKNLNGKLQTHNERRDIIQSVIHSFVMLQYLKCTSLTKCKFHACSFTFCRGSLSSERRWHGDVETTKWTKVRNGKSGRSKP
jgi:hypothetical protein